MGYIASNEEMTATDELWKMWKEVVVDYFRYYLEVSRGGGGGWGSTLRPHDYKV
jgi:hypothetical protein